MVTLPSPSTFAMLASLEWKMDNQVTSREDPSEKSASTFNCCFWPNCIDFRVGSNLTFSKFGFPSTE